MKNTIFKTIRKTFNFLNYDILIVKRNKVRNIDLIQDVKNILNQTNEIVIFDVGANLGQSINLLKTYFHDSTIYSFEPEPNLFLKLKKNTLIYDRINLYNFGFGNSEFETILNLQESSGGNSILDSAKDSDYFSLNWLQHKGSVNIKITTLDNFCENNKINNIDLLKLDTQGYELNILRGAKNLLINKKIKIIYSEVLFEKFYEKQAFFCEIYNFLISVDYRFIGLYNINRDSKNFNVLFTDALFIPNLKNSNNE